MSKIRSRHWRRAGAAWARTLAAWLAAGCVVCLTAPAAAALAESSGEKLPPPGFEISTRPCDPLRAVRKAANAYQGPMVDTHAHLYPPQGRDASMADIRRGDLQRILDLLDSLDVVRIFFMPTPNDGIRRHQELGVVRRKLIREMDPGRVRLFGGSNYLTTWLHKAFRDGYAPADLQRRLDRLSADIDTGRIQGVGEMAIYHFNKGYGRQHVLSFAPDFAAWQAVVDRVARHGLWMDLHVEPMHPKGKSYAQRAFGGLELLYRRHPDLKLIYAHTAMTGPENVRRMLETYPRLMMNIKVEPRHDRWGHLAPVVNPRGELYEDWAAVFEAHPRRFMIGTDFHFGRRGLAPRKYKRSVARVRKVLGALNPRAARMIAHDNARRLFP